MIKMFYLKAGLVYGLIGGKVTLAVPTDDKLSVSQSGVTGSLSAWSG